MMTPKHALTFRVGRIALHKTFSHLDNKNTEIAFNLINQRCMESSSGIILTSLDKSDITHFDKELFL